MTLLAHHAGEDSLVNLAPLGVAWLSFMVAVARARLTAVLARLKSVIGRVRLTAARAGLTRRTRLK